MDPPRWLVDEMLGRLARYLRFVGGDAAYVRGMTDEEIVERARREDRVLLTRDRDLARRCPAALRITSPYLAEQWREVRAAWPEMPVTVALVRCSRCNGPLEPRGAGQPVAEEVPPPVREGATPLFACATCGHLYWEGSHTADIRRRIAAWEAGGPA